MSRRRNGAVLVVLALVAGMPWTMVGSAALAAQHATNWYYSGTLTVAMTASSHDQSGRCNTTATAIIYENDKPALTSMKDRSSLTINFQEQCIATRPGASTITTYWFTADNARLYDGRPIIPLDPKKGTLEGAPVRTQPFFPNLSPDILSHGKAAVHDAYLPPFYTKIVTVLVTHSGQITKTADVNLKTILLYTPLIGVYKTNRAGVITLFHGDHTFKPYYFENLVGTMRVTWNLGYHPLTAHG